MGVGIEPFQLGDHREYWGGIPFKVEVATVAATSSYQVFAGGAPFKCRVLGMSGVMSGAGAASDTVQLQDGSSNAITEAVDVSALSDKDKWDVATVDDTYYDIDAGENLKIVTASGALSLVYVELMRVE